MRFLLILLLGSVVVGCHRDQSSLELQLTASKSSVGVGEEIVFSEHLQNKSSETVFENFRSFYRHASELAFYGGAKSEYLGTPEGLIYHDQPLPAMFDKNTAPGFTAATGTSSHHATELGPGEGKTVTYTFKIMKPGVYQFSTTWSSFYSADHQEELWKGDLTSNIVTITVLPHNKARANGP